MRPNSFLFNNASVLRYRETELQRISTLSSRKLIKEIVVFGCFCGFNLACSLQSLEF